MYRFESMRDALRMVDVKSSRDRHLSGFLRDLLVIVTGRFP